MPKTYYTFPQNEYPPLTLAILERIRLYICSLLYPTEEYSVSQQKFILSDISPNMALRENINLFKLSNVTFPFTAYSISDSEPDTSKENSYAKTMNYYSPTFGCNIHTMPVLQTFPMITFYTTSKDYDRAKTILYKESSLPTKLDVPIYVNEILTSFTIVLDFEISKGTYAFEFEQQLTAGNISDLVHNVICHYHQIIIDTDSLHPVDDIEVAMKLLDSYKSASRISLVPSETVPDSPAVSSTIPTDEETDVEVDSTIFINFSQVMKEQTVEDAISIEPPVDADYVWNSGSTQLAIDIYTDLISGTSYTVTVEDTAEGIYDKPLDEDYEFSFTTK